MDNQKDFYIKSKLKEDDLISKKADDIFNNFLKGEINMKEDIDEKIVNINTAKEKRFNMKKILSIVATFMIVFLGVNVYAATQGHNNIFFIIKNLVTPELVTDREEILSDRDITISYQPIEISKNLKIEINRLYVKENEAVLNIRLDELYPLDYYPTTYLIYDITSQEKVLLGEHKTSRGDFSAFEGLTYTEELKLKGFKNNTTKLELEVQDQNEELILLLEIDLENKEIEVLNTRNIALEKISESELKETLGLYANLLKFDAFNAGDYFESKEEFIKETLVECAVLLIQGKDGYVYKEGEGYSKQEVHEAIKEICGNEYESPINLEHSLVYYDTERGRYDLYAGDGLEPAFCLDIRDVSYYNGIYTVDFVYCYASDIDFFENSIESLDRFQATIKLKLNEESEYTKYCITNLEEVEGKSYVGENDYEINSSTSNTIENTVLINN